MQKLSSLRWESDIIRYMSCYFDNPRPINDISWCIGLYFSHIKTATNLSHNTIRIRYFCLSIFDRWLNEQGISSINGITSDTIKDYLDYCINSRHQKHSMLKCTKVALRQFFVILFELKIIDSNPAIAMIVNTCPQKYDFEILSPDEQLAIINTANVRYSSYIQNNHVDKRHRYYALRDIAIVMVLSAAGVRTGELCSIKVSDVNLQNGCINIAGKGNDVYLKCFRKVYIDIPEVINAIEDFLKVRPESDILFCSWSGTSVSSAAIISAVKNICKLAGISRNITPYAFRHTLCSTMLHNNADLFSAKELLGHKKILTTLQYYTHFNDEQLHAQNSSFNPLGGISL